jgi:dihydrodipicolinate synthase/N-acetylneuraminate lyase
LVGAKEALTDISHMLAYKWDLRKGFRVYTGPESVILSALRSGLDGSLGGAGSYATELFVRLVREYESPEALEIQRLFPDLATIPRKYGQWSANYAMTKIARGYEVGAPFLPSFGRGIKKDGRRNKNDAFTSPKSKFVRQLQTIETVR